MDSATEFLFGSCVESLHETLPYPHYAPQNTSAVPKSPADEFSEAFRDAQWRISCRARLGFLWPWAELFEEKTKKSMAVVDAFLQPIIDEALQKKTARLNGREDVADETLLDSLVRSTSGRLYDSV